ncbi:MAG: DUF2723 domain-containing protein [Candidatus Zixiibacteriota bacterium]
MEESRFRRTQYVVGGLTALFTLMVYAMTVAPTFSYWDCGEFIACSYILGIPHPPGTPLFVMLGRVFTLLPISADYAVRVNYISVVTSAMAAFIAFFVTARLVRAGLQGMTLHPLERWQAMVVLGGGVCGALFLAFSSTHWNNAVEAEVYGASMFLILALGWMAMHWADEHSELRVNRYLVAISYVALLSVGIHMTVYLVMPVVFLFVIIVDPALRRDWRFWLTGLILFTVAVDLTWFLLGSAFWLAISVIMALGRRALGWGLIAAIMVAAWLGYSSQLFLPIRSAQNPHIDENNPETFKAFRSFLERKQYGQTGMIKRSFDRRGTLANQFGDHAHMGFYRYWRVQYGFDGWAMLPVILVGSFGAYWLYRRSPPQGVFLVALFLVGSVGLIWYMNFADGTQYYRLNPDAYMEVRNRDYFFTPGFIVFGMMMGLGLAGLAARLGEKGGRGRTAAVAVAVIAALLPLRTLQANWRGADRSQNYTPYDYAWNLLQSCSPNAILFTSGDNDTFPLWCIQDVYGVRKDVSIVNLSLAQTDWYIMQMKYQWGLPVTFDDDQILWTVPDNTTGGLLERPKEPYRDPVSGNRHYLFATRDGDRYVPVSMMIVEHVVINNAKDGWKRPIFFSSGPADKSRLGLEKRTRMVGQAFEVLPEERAMEFDYPATAKLMDSVFLYRGYDNPKVGLDDNGVGMSLAFPERMIAVSDYYRRAGDTTRWIDWMDKARKTFPAYYRTHETWAAYQHVTGDSAAAQQTLVDGVATIQRYVDEMPDNRLYWFSLGKMQEDAGRDTEAERSLARAFWMNPNDGMVYNDYVGFLAQRGKTAEAARAAVRWLTYYPKDQRARTLAGAARR